MKPRPMGVFQFGIELLKTNDLDPIYVMLYHSPLSKNVLRKWLLAYWCFYSIETCNRIINYNDYWEGMRAAASSSDFKRGTERRHFRGNLAITSVEDLSRLSVSERFKPLETVESVSYLEVINQVMTWRGFGPWIAFKVADMLDRLGFCSIKFDYQAQSKVMLFDSPKEGAKRVTERYGGNSNQPEVWAVNKLSESLGRFKAPPDYQRPINIQEIETILCKWKSHTNGHYQLGEDLKTVRLALSNPKTEIERHLIKGCKLGGIW